MDRRAVVVGQRGEGRQQRAVVIQQPGDGKRVWQIASPNLHLPHGLTLAADRRILLTGPHLRNAVAHGDDGGTGATRESV